MALEVSRGQSWGELVAAYADRLAVQPPSPFEQTTVLVSSRGAGRLLRQGLAAELPAGICAGLELVTPSAWCRERALAHGAGSAYESWHSARTAVVVARALDRLAAQHAILGAHLSGDRSPVRRQHLAQRSVRLFNHYTDNAPAMVERWLAGDDVDAAGSPLSEHLSWQPALLRLAAELLECDPVEAWRLVARSIEGDGSGAAPTVFALPELNAVQSMLLTAAAATGTVHVWQLQGSPFEDWTVPMGAPAATAAAPATPRMPGIEVIGSHGPARMAEVLRDALCRRFDADPGLQPRDVVVVCDRPEIWRPHLATAFLPAEDDPDQHPGRSLRLWPGSMQEPNLVADAVVTCLRLSDVRATATDLSELMLSRPVAERWRLGDDGERLLTLVTAAGIRWGLDRDHRQGIGVPGITQNTWFRGVDRLLAGLTVAPGSDAGLGVTGVADVGTSDLELLGSVAEIISRLRRFNAEAAAPAEAAAWVLRIRGLLDELVSCGPDDEWMLAEVNATLADMAKALSSTNDELSRHEFSLMFEQSLLRSPARAAVGNGNLHVIGVGDLVHVDFRLACLLGVADAAADPTPDSVDLGPDVPDPRRRRLAQLLARARSCDQLLVVTQTRDPNTNQEVTVPTTISWLLGELGREEPGVVTAPALAHSESNFTDGGGYDRHGLEGALSLRRARAAADSPAAERRRGAIGLPVEQVAVETSVTELASFLSDPAREFLRSAAGVRLWEGPRLLDELPFVQDGLQTWQLRDRLLDSFRQGMTPAEAALRESGRELLPPGNVGRRALETPLQEVGSLWRQAYPQWSAPVVDHPVHVRFDDVVVTGAVRTRGGEVVAVTVSDGRRTEVEPWLAQLVLAATGVSVPAVVHRLDRHYQDRYPSQAVLPAPGREAALATLGSIVAAFRQGRQRLVPLPQDLGLAFADQLARGTYQARLWQPPATNWRETLWRRHTPAWQLFYDGVPSEVFADAATDRDPAPPPGHPSAFASWAAAIYLPLVGGAA